MVACLEKTEGNSDFHEIVDFLASSSIHHALTINVTVDSKAVVVTETSIRSSLLFNDVDGIACLTIEAIFQNLALMGYEDSRESLEGTNRNEGDQVQTPHDSPLLGGHTSDKAEGALNLQELSVLCTNLSNRCSLHALEYYKGLHKLAEDQLSMKKKFRKKESVSKQGRIKSEPELTLDDSTVFDDQDADHGMEPARSILTLKPLPTINPKDKGKSVLEEPEPTKKMIRSDFDVAQIAKKAEIANQLQEDVASREREEYTNEERTKFLAETIAAQRKFRAAQRSAKIRSRPPTKSQLRNLMMTCLKENGSFKHIRAKAKSLKKSSFTMSNRHQELASPEAKRLFVKDASPKQTDACNEALAIPEQTTIGKEISILFMAGSLSKNT
ncbi:hypothetical protein Tco_1274132 [Tanacetum coccineum]